LTNKIINESGSYLNQHEDNTVDWLICNKESLKKTQKEQKLIFLNVGYASYHWCHVMENQTYFEKLKNFEDINNYIKTII
jgi:hypothetical protein|tara:strand:- start:575 stop:814 length:240 start_codon:yes stop_codon:yes gene_type:complete